MPAPSTVEAARAQARRPPAQRGSSPLRIDHGALDRQAASLPFRRGQTPGARPFRRPGWDRAGHRQPVSLWSWALREGSSRTGRPCFALPRCRLSGDARAAMRARLALALPTSTSGTVCGRPVRPVIATRRAGRLAGRRSGGVHEAARIARGPRSGVEPGGQVRRSAPLELVEIDPAITRQPSHQALRRRARAPAPAAHSWSAGRHRRGQCRCGERAEHRPGTGC